MKSKMTKATDISKKTKDIVWERDNHRCIFCGNSQAMPNAHYIRRSHSGLGIPENVVTLCAICHHEFDNGGTEKSLIIKNHIRDYLNNYYPAWSEEKLIYRKWE